MSALTDSFAVAERPVIMVELEFDGGSINHWTRPFSGSYDGRNYSPFGALGGSLSIRQSLDNPSLDATAEFSGTSDEIRNAALLEEFQGRPAYIRLGNLNAAGEIEADEVIFSGTIEDIPIIEDREGVTIAVQLESVFSKIGRARDLRYSKADQAKVNASDSFFDFIGTVSDTSQRFGG